MESQCREQGTWAHIESRGGQRWSCDREGLWYRQPLLVWKTQEQCPTKTLLFANQHHKLGKQHIFVLAAAHVASLPPPHPPILARVLFFFVIVALEPNKKGGWES